MTLPLWFRRILNFFGLALPDAPSHRLAPNVKSPDREKRRVTRQLWRAFHHNQQWIGCPILTGARLERTIEQCSPKHLTITPKGWNQ